MNKNLRDLAKRTSDHDLEPYQPGFTSKLVSDAMYVLAELLTSWKDLHGPAVSDSEYNILDPVSKNIWLNLQMEDDGMRIVDYKKDYGFSEELEGLVEKITKNIGPFVKEDHEEIYEYILDYSE